MSFKDKGARAERIQAAKDKRVKLKNVKKENAEQADFDNELHVAEKMSNASFKSALLVDLVKSAPDWEVMRVAEKAFQVARERGGA